MMGFTGRGIPPDKTNAKELAPPHQEFDPRYHIIGADYRDVFGNLLWMIRPYPYKRLSAINEIIIENSVRYIVHRVAIADGIIHINIVAS